MLPLDDVTVLDLSRVLAGPFASMLLGDFGARVIKVEPPGGDDTRGFGPPFDGDDACYYLSVNRNKRSIAVDLKQPGGVALMQQLAARADVVLENFRPGVMDRLGLAPAALLAANPRLIIASISGYGQTGLPEWIARPGYDVVLQGVGGIPSLTGPEDGPPYKVGTSIADLTAGLYAVIGVLTALHARTRSGRGQHVDVSMLDGQISLLSYHAQACFAGAPPRRLGNAHPSVAPYGSYRARDGFFNLGVANDKHFRRLCEDVLARPEFSTDVRFVTNAARVAARVELDALLAPLLAARTVEEWLATLDVAGIPAGPVLGVAEALAHPQVRARGMVTEVDDVVRGRLTTLGVPVRLADTPGAVRRAPPRLGEHSDELLREVLALGDEEIARLRADGVVLS